jgi:hypothetical protein
MVTIELTKGKVAIIDEVDNVGLKWYYGGNGYAVRKNRKEGMIYLHRWVMENKLGRKLKPKEHVDHISGVKLDCTRDNLRPCTMAQNIANAKIRSDNTSGVRGVSIDKRNGRYLAQYYIKGKKYHIGSYVTKEEAIKARKDKEIKLYKDFVINGQWRYDH